MSDTVDTKLRLTRKQLSELSTNIEIIKQFEKLFRYMNELYPDVLTSIIDIETRVTALENP